MTGSDTQEVSASDVAEVLSSMAELMSTFRQHDLALQDALSSISARARATPEMGNLQHVDLITQTHNDLASLLPKLAAILNGEDLGKDALRHTLTLRSLQDLLIDGADEQTIQTGELALF